MSQSNHINPAFRADGWVLLIFLLLLAFGWISVCGASHSFGEMNFFSFDSRAGKQLLWIGCSLGLGMIILMFDDHYFDMLADLFYWIMMLVPSVSNPRSLPSAPRPLWWPNFSIKTDLPSTCGAI